MNMYNPVIKSIGMNYIPVSENKCSELDQLKILLHQYLLSKYLEITGSTRGPLIDEFFYYIQNKINNLHGPISSYGVDKEIYQYIYNTIIGIRNKSVNSATIDEALSFPFENKDLEGNYPDKDFYIPLLHVLGFGYPSDIYTDAIKVNAAILLPSIVYPGGNNKGLMIHLKKVIIPDYNFTLFEKERDLSINDKKNIFQYLAGFNFIDFTIDDLIGILATFSLEHGKYTSYSPDDYYPLVSDACYEVVTNSNILSGAKVAYDARIFISLLEKLYKYHRIGNLKDTSVFSILVAKLDIPDNLLVSSYFNRTNSNEVVANEALAFKNSPFSKFMEYKLNNLIVGNEEFDVNADEDETSLTSNTEEDNTSTDSSGNDPIPTEDIQPESDANKKLLRDPTKLLIQLARSDESFTDYMYRELVIARIGDLLTNPPKNIPTKELNLLQRWRNNWINLVSIITIRDFLSRLSFTLMNVVKDEDETANI